MIATNTNFNQYCYCIKTPARRVETVKRLSMATNQTRVFSPTDFIKRQGTVAELRPITFIGITRETTEKNEISFAFDFDRTNWIAVPSELVESVEVLGTARAGEHTHPRVSLQLKDPQTPDGRLFVSIATAMQNALISVQSRILPALFQSGGVTYASAACTSCIEQCQLVVVTPEDPFARLACMLNCADCPG